MRLAKGLYRVPKSKAYYIRRQVLAVTPCRAISRRLPLFECMKCGGPGRPGRRSNCAVLLDGEVMM
jgi:hypothetical protein